MRRRLEKAENLSEKHCSEFLGNSPRKFGRNFITHSKKWKTKTKTKALESMRVCCTCDLEQKSATYDSKSMTMNDAQKDETNEKLQIIQKLKVYHSQQKQVWSKIVKKIVRYKSLYTSSFNFNHFTTHTIDKNLCISPFYYFS